MLLLNDPTTSFAKRDAGLRRSGKACPW